MAFSSRKFTFISCLLASVGPAWGLGLGNVSGVPVLGQNLLLEIPLLGTDEGIPALECFKIRPPSVEIESGFVLRNAQVQILSDHNQVRLVITSASAVREPIIEFSLAVSCGFGLSKDYLLLTSEPAKLAVQVPSAKPASVPTAELPDHRVLASKPLKSGPTASGELPLQIAADVTLEKLARQRYPLQPKAREKFIRMLMDANPELVKKIDDVIPAGSELHLPSGLPIRRESGSPIDVKAVVTYPSATKQTATIYSPQSKEKTAKQDMLVLGHSGTRNAAELLAEAERLTALLVEQTNNQSAAADKLTQLEDQFRSLQKHASVLENRIHVIEAERQAEKLAPKPASFDFVELLLAILAGGALGGLSLYFHNLIQSRRENRLNKASGGNFDGGSRYRSGLPTTSADNQDVERLPWQTQPKLQTGTKIAGRSMAASAGNPGPAADMPRPAPQPASPQNDFDFVSKP